MGNLKQTKIITIAKLNTSAASMCDEIAELLSDATPGRRSIVNLQSRLRPYSEDIIKSCLDKLRMGDIACTLDAVTLYCWIESKYKSGCVLLVDNNPVIAVHHNRFIMLHDRIFVSECCDGGNVVYVGQFSVNTAINSVKESIPDSVASSAKLFYVALYMAFYDIGKQDAFWEVPGIELFVREHMHVNKLAVPDRTIAKLKENHCLSTPGMFVGSNGVMEVLDKDDNTLAYITVLGHYAYVETVSCGVRRTTEFKIYDDLYLNPIHLKRGAIKSLMLTYVCALSGISVYTYGVCARDVDALHKLDMCFRQIRNYSDFA